MTPSGATTEDGGYTEVALIDLENKVNVSVLLRQEQGFGVVGYWFPLSYDSPPSGEEKRAVPGRGFSPPPARRVGNRRSSITRC